MSEYLTFDLVCEKCNENFTWIVKKRSYSPKDIRKCCSRKCANSRIQTVEMNISRRNKLLGREGKPSPYKGLQYKDRVIKECEDVECSNTFTILPSNGQKYCTECRSKHIGGYREGSGRSRHGYYKGIYCGSTYELVWVIYNLDHNIEFSRFDGMLKGDDVNYVPDFIIGNTIYEIKGVDLTNTLDKKCKLAREYGYNIVVLYKEDIQYMFDYVSSKYDTKKFVELYDNHRPKYRYTCTECGLDFESDLKRRTLRKFCSKECSAKYSPNRIDRDSVIRLYYEGKSNKEISNELGCNSSHLSEIVRDMIKNGTVDQLARSRHPHC